MAASNSLNMDTSGVQTYNATTGGLDGSATTQYAVQCGDANNKIQSVASLGTSGQVLTSNGAGALPTFQDAAAGGSTITVTKYTANDTWTMAADTQMVEIICWNSGGGGGSGRRGLTTAAGGGGGGAGGGGFYYQIPAGLITGAVTITIGGTANGGSAQTVNSTDGTAGSPTNVSSFGTLLYSNADAAGGTGGTATSAAGDGAKSFNLYPMLSFGAQTTVVAAGNGGNAAGGSVAAANNTGVGLFLPTAGGGGAGADSTTERTGGNGGAQNNWFRTTSFLVAASAGGVESGTIDGTAGTNGVSATGRITGGTGGGGGGGQKSGGAAGNGGNGGTPAGGGGGGGGSLNGTNSGAGGNGARGEIWVIEHS